MALSEREQRLLDEMERGLYRSEADVMQTVPRVRRRTNYRSLVLGIVVVLIGVGVLIGGVVVQQLWLGLVGFAVMLGGVLLMFSRGSEAPSEHEFADTGSPSPNKSDRESLSERMERRWDERMGGER